MTGFSSKEEIELSENFIKTKLYFVSMIYIWKLRRYLEVWCGVNFLLPAERLFILQLS